MFGYVKTFTPELKVCESEHYKAIYCGLCKTLGKRYGFFSRLTLNYDFAFLSIIYKDILNEPEKIKKCRCFVHPFKCKNCACESLALDFSAACAMIMLYYKILDNIQDSSFFKKIVWYVVLPFAKSWHKKAAQFYPEVEKIISEQMKRQTQIEKKSETFVDEAADPSGCMLKEICMQMTDDPLKKEALGRFGYLFGRWIYLIDALDDLENDKKDGSFNVFSKENDGAKRAVLSLNSTAAELQNAYSEVGFSEFAPIISNVVFLGLKDTLNRVMKKGGYICE